MKNKIAVLLTCFNRKELTIACLDKLFSQSKSDDFNITVFLVDDGSSDGTSEAVKSEYPQTILIAGSGDLYWNGGMQLAWETALKHQTDFFLWLNDDVELKNNALDILLSTFKAVKNDTVDPVIVGNLADVNTGKLTYGGYSVDKGLMHFRSTKLPISNNPTACDTINGNVVLIPKATVERIGTLSKKFTHAMGDFEYGLRCTKAGIPIFSTASYVGTCSNNSIKNTWADPETPLSERLQKLHRPTGLPPAEYFNYIKENTNSFTATIMIIKLYMKVMFPSLWLKISKLIKVG